MTRLQDFVNDLRVKYELANDEIISGLLNGDFGCDFEAPEWISKSETTAGVKLWDANDGGSAKMGFIEIKENVDLVAKLNFADTTVLELESAVKISKKKNINFYETLCKYCADNDVDLSLVSDVNFEAAANAIENYGRDDTSTDVFYFWLDAE